MTDQPGPILVAVAWPYASGPRHLGHVAGFGVPSDIFARYHRLKGSRVLMVSGTDDHGTPSLIAADKEGVTPRELVDRYNAVITDDLLALGLTYDLFTRTTTVNHGQVAQDVFRVLHEKGFLIRRTLPGAFSAVTGRGLPDRYVEGTCPRCGFANARGDQCDNCGSQLDPLDLIDPRSKIDGQPPVFRDSEQFFLDLPAFGERLREWIASNEHWRPNVRNFSLRFVDELKPRAITRDIDWGVPIPLPEFVGRDDKRLYVWFEAVIGYLSASIEWARESGQPEVWREWWQDPNSRHFYFMGKDNIVFHTVLWPSILMGYGGFELPYNVVSSEFLTMEGQKFSSSRGIAIYVNDFLERYSADSLRFFLTIAGPETNDADFTWSEFVKRNNGELVATWGNLAHRTLTNAYRNFGQVPESGELTRTDSELINAIEGGFQTVGRHIEAARFKVALAEAMRLASLVNQYLTIEEPWKKLKTDPERAASALYVALRCVDNLKTLFIPFLPFSSQRLHEMLGYDGVIAGSPEYREVAEDGVASHRVLTGRYSDWIGRWEPSALASGQKLREPAPLFAKLDEGIVAEELARMEQAPA